MRQENVQQQERLKQISDQQRINVDPSPQRFDGYLFKRSHKKFKTWSRFVQRSWPLFEFFLVFRRWFFVRQGQLLYVKRAESAPTVLINDLRLCTVRIAADHDRRFVFELISPQSTDLLQADSQVECEQWINGLQSTISDLFKSNNATVSFVVMIVR
jgi:Arf-GAP with coiled-coil, ANK repeat and PH domain-containing protein